MHSIEAVTVCVNYGDFLRAVAPFNRPHFNRWVVVTVESDTLTREVCRNHSIECLITDEFYREGKDSFCKSRGINKGLDHLRGDGWLMHLDADICLPFDMAVCLEDAHLQPENIYGADRINCTGYQAWQTVQKQGLYSREHGWLVEKRRPETWVGGQPAGNGIGWAPIGYFQLWHGTQTLTWGFPKRRYPVAHGNAARTDVQFALQWDRKNRLMIPELLVFHLESEEAPMGANWKGRKTKPFAPPVVVETDGEAMGVRHSGRHHPPHHHPHPPHHPRPYR